MKIPQFNYGFRRMFSPGKLTLSVSFPIEAYSGSIPRMENQVELAQYSEELGFAALWFRDVPLHDPNFGDVGQIYDPWVFLGFIAAQTRKIALITGSIIFPLRHPLHIAKAAASVDVLSKGRLVLGVASGDRPIEYPAFNVDFLSRGKRFRDTFFYIKESLQGSFPSIDSPLGSMNGGTDLIPKPFEKDIPLMATGYSQQNLEWLAEHSDGWLYYPSNLERQKKTVETWRRLTESLAGNIFKPFVQSLYIDLTEDPNCPPSPIHLGFRGGRNVLIDFLSTSQEIGVNNITLNVKFATRPIRDILEELGKEVLPLFPAHE